MDENKQLQQLIDKLNNEPLYLAQVAVWNNPADIANRAAAMGIPGAYENPSELLDLIFDSDLSGGDLITLFEVEPDPEGENGDTIMALFDARAASLEAGTSPTWSGLFPKAVRSISNTWADYNGKPPVDPSSPTGSTRKRCGCHRRPDRFIDAVLCLLGIALLIFLIRKW